MSGDVSGWTLNAVPGVKAGRKVRKALCVLEERGVAVRDSPSQSWSMVGVDGIDGQGRRDGDCRLLLFRAGGPRGLDHALGEW